MKGHKEERKGRRSTRAKISNKIDDLKVFNIQEPTIFGIIMQGRKGCVLL
jgi:hypothetical protein